MNDAQEKSEDATPFKLEEARKKGSVPHSADLLSFAVIAAFLAALAATGAGLVRLVMNQTRWWLENAGLLARSPDWLAGTGALALQAVGRALLPVIAAVVIVAVLTNLLFGGVVFSTEPLRPDFKRLHPVAGFKRVFSRRLLLELGKLLVKLVLFATMLWLLAGVLLPVLLGAVALPPMHLPLLLWRLLLRCGGALLVVMAVAAAWDVWSSRGEFLRQMRMSRQEVKEEYRRREGDPEVKARRKRTQQALIRKLGALARVKDADVILTNPTHVAVALQYRPATMAVPVVLALGQGLLAGQILRLARRHRVPVLRRPPLARRLYRQGGVDHPVPVDCEHDVAAVYRWVISRPGHRVVMP